MELLGSRQVKVGIKGACRLSRQRACLKCTGGSNAHSSLTLTQRVSLAQLQIPPTILSLKSEHEVFPLFCIMSAETPRADSAAQTQPSVTSTPGSETTALLRPPSLSSSVHRYDHDPVSVPGENIKLTATLLCTAAVGTVLTGEVIIQAMRK